ncbi:MAG: hypothetical protein IID46_00730, partial [Planctomycetes bacterium]|nr:hypothetical protein [Planctomycetota bacterium]
MLNLIEKESKEIQDLNNRIGEEFIESLTSQRSPAGKTVVVMLAYNAASTLQQTID